MVLPDGGAPCQQDCAPYHTLKSAQQWPEEQDKELKKSTWFPNSQDPNLIRVMFRIHRDPTLDWTWLEPVEASTQHLWAILHQDVVRRSFKSCVL